jgi:EAL domain-containing protein (putative c-di-GMP-specific phosphodiesterase class I)
VSDADHNSPARLALLGDLRRGLDRGELEMHYQPKLYLDSGRPAGMEALVRWQHPVRGLMGPMEFIPLIEQSYLMHELTARVIDLTLGQASLWWQAGMTVQVSLNVAARDLLDSGLPDLVERGLKRHGLPAAALLLEIDERVLTSEPAHAAATAEALAALGVSLSLDDFGTGYSSLVRLKRLPVEEIKIDASFVQRLTASSAGRGHAGESRASDDVVIVRSIIDLVRTLGLRSVAEGVEDARTAQFLRDMGCDAAQGWHFGRPMDAETATSWLHAWSTTSPVSVPQPDPPHTIDSKFIA